MVNRELIKSCVTPAELCAAEGHELRTDGNQFRGPCPMCGGSKWATKFVVNDDLWHCKGCNKGGDTIQLYMDMFNCGFSSACAQLANKFNITGDISLAEIKQKYHERYIKKTSALAEQEKSEEHARITWEGLELSCERGEAYLYERAITNWRDHDIRFSGFGVCLPLYSLDGDVINVVCRFFEEQAGKKVVGLKNCSSLGTFGDFSKLGDTEQVDVVIVEGVFDYLTACSMFSSSEEWVFGVHGASTMPKIVAGLASTRKVRSFKFYEQDDKAGAEAVSNSVNVCLNWNIDYVVNTCGGYNDLNEMYRALLNERCT